MEPAHKKVLKSISLELRHLLEGSYDSTGRWRPGDLEQRLAAIGVRRDREPVRVDEMPHLSTIDRKARQVIDAYLKLRAEAGVDRAEAVAEFVRETAYTWANRLLALRCMEARELIDEVVLQKAAYGGRSLEHHRLAQRQPELCAGEDDGLLAVLEKVFSEQAGRLPMLFDPEAPGVALKPSAAAIKRCMALLSESRIGFQPVSESVSKSDRLQTYPTALERQVENLSYTSEVFKAPDAFGWAYQYWNTEEKDRVFEKVRTQKGAKIEGADIIPATQLYTEPYMVKFLVQNSLGATWMGMYPDSKLFEKWEYYVRDADRAVVERNSFRSEVQRDGVACAEKRNESDCEGKRNEFRSTREITFLDPACGSGHFLLEAFDLFYEMYAEEGQVTEPDAICRSILENNLYGIDIDVRAVQIAEVALWMKAAERAFGFQGRPTNLVAAVASHLTGPAWEDFLKTFPNEPSIARVLRQFGKAMEHIDQLGSLARPEEELRAIIHEEHATWERQVAVKKEANFLFAEMAEDKLSGQLPFHEVSDEEFGERMQYRARAAIHAFTQKAKRDGAFQDQFLGYEAAAGFRLLDVLGRKYDVVAANPPYMGNKTMPPVLREQLSQFYSVGKRDLFVAFMLRCRELSGPGSLVAMVTQQSWMFASGLSAFRGADAADGIRAGFLRCNFVRVLAHLGPGGFSEISGEVVNSVLVIFSPRPPEKSNSTFAVRAVQADNPSDKAAILRLLPENATSRFQQLTLLGLPGAPVAYWLGEVFTRLLAGTARIESQADVLPGLKTGEDARFLRFCWESRGRTAGWVPYSKGGSGYAKWYGQNEYCLDWRNGKVPYQQYRDSRQPYSEYYLRDGYTFSAASKGALGVRRLVAAAICGAKGPGIFPKNGNWIVAVLNSRVCSYLIRAMTVGLDILVENVRALPSPTLHPDLHVQLDEVLAEVEKIASFARSSDPTDRGFTVCPASIEVDAAETLLLTCEAVLEELVGELYGLSKDALATVYEDVGSYAGAMPLLGGHDDLPKLVKQYPCIASSIKDRIAKWKRHDFSAEQIVAIKDRVRVEYENCSSHQFTDSEKDDEPSVDEESESLLALGSPIPTESFLEEVSLRLGANPISVYSLLKEGIETEGWRRLPEEQRRTRNHLTVFILRMLGHRWPKQIEAGEPVPDWADADGIIPLTERGSKRTLVDRLVQRNLFRLPAAAGGEAIENGALQEIAAAGNGAGSDSAGNTVNSVMPSNGMNSVLREFAELMGKPLDQWLATEFFKHHTSQFKKRPIAWQMQSGKFTARSQPAFACLIYYHKLDGDLLEKLRTQYVGPLRQRWETELRGIESVAASARSERQTTRRTELGEVIKELQDFDSLLRAVQERGFETESLREYAVQDALLSAKSRWLCRLGEKIQAGPLGGWKKEAEHCKIAGDGEEDNGMNSALAGNGINSVLPGWIEEAVSHLNHHCTEIGPEAWKSADDPTPTSLAESICAKPATLVAGALACANREWLSRLDKAVLLPLRQEMNEKKETLKCVQAEQKELGQQALTSGSSSVKARGELKDDERRLKAEIKELKDRIAEIAAGAEELKERIESWKCREADGWESWLAEQPMYDAISSTDGHRQPPATVPEWIAQEQSYLPDINDGVRVNIAPLQKAGVLAAEVLAKKDVDKAIADRAEWRADERRWCREGKLPQPGWWRTQEEAAEARI